MVKLFFSTFTILVLSLLLCANGISADRVMYENFDDRALDARLTIYGNNWVVLSPPQYNLNATGRGGTGYAFASGTVATANICWRRNMLNPWPSDELYVSFWMRYPTFTRNTANPMENLKLFYPHWNGTDSYVHYTVSDGNTVYYSAKGNGTLLTGGNWINCPNMTDGNWHHYEFWVKFSTAQSRFWYDGEAKLDQNYADGVWTPSTMNYVWAPSIDAEDPSSFSRVVDDWEVWDGMPTGQTGERPSMVTGLRVTEAQ